MRINVLGPPQMGVPQMSTSVRSGRRGAMLAALLLRANRTVSRPRLVDAIWCDDPPSSAMANIRTYASDLRRALGPTADGGARVVGDSTGYAIEVRPGELDLIEFGHLAQAGLSACRAGSPSAALESLEPAVAMWRGQPFDGIELGSWAAAEARALEERRWEVLSAWVDARIAVGRCADLDVRLRAMVEERPLAEHAWAQLMVVLHRIGRGAEALAVFDEAGTALRRELGVEPGTELHAARRRVLGTPTIASRPPCTLPVTPPLSGREDLAAALAAVLTDPAGPSVVALSGSPGAGTTTLAVGTAHTLHTRFPDGLLYHSFRSTGTDEVLAVFLRMLGVPAAELPSGPDGRAALFRMLTAERSVLLVLDDVTDSTAVHALLPPAGRSRALVCGRWPHTGPTPVHHLRVGPLALGGAVDLLRAELGAERVRAEAEQARHIARACGRVPLALKIVAGRLRTRPAWTLATMAARLADPSRRLAELVHGDRSVRSTLADRYRLLGPEEHRVVRMIATSAAAMASASDVAARLGSTPATDLAVERLMSVNVLEVVTQPPDAEVWYRLDELFALYVREVAGATDRGAERC